jgi:penicillin-binding protein 1A
MGCSSEAGKTGTSEEESDAWFVGYTPKYSTAVWVGHPTSREYTGFGGPTAGPIWRTYMESAQEGDCPEFEVPESLPELSAFTGGHTAGSSSSYYNEGEEEGYEYEEEAEGEEEQGEEEGETETGTENKPVHETAAPPATPPPSSPAGGGLSPR